jgi:hypothetical protein
VHAQDLAYTFWNGDTVDSFGGSINMTLTSIIQSVEVQFVLTGNPNVVSTTGEGSVELPLYEADANILF